MEWSRIKNILIVALILTNLLFIYMIIAPDTDNAVDDSDLLADTLTIMTKNNITVSADIPRTDDAMPVITLTYDEENGTYYYTPSEKTQPLDETTAKNLADDFVDSLNLPSSRNSSIKMCSVYQSEENNSLYTVSYGNFYEDYKIEDCYLICTVSSNGVIGLTRNWASAEQAGKSRREIIPVSTALLKYMKLIQSDDPLAGAEITQIALVYKIDSEYSGRITSDTAFPSWKITDSENNVTYIPAYN